MRTRSPMKNIQLRNEDQDKRRWKTMRAVNRRADCQAWNLYIERNTLAIIAGFNAVCDVGI